MAKSLPLDFLNGPIVDSRGRPSKSFADYLRKAIEAPLAPIAVRTPEAGVVGQIQPTAVVAGRSEGIATTVANINSSGKLQPAGVGFTVDNVPDGIAFQRTTPNQVTGAGRAFNALNSRNQLANSFVNTGVNVSSAPNSSSVLNNSGSATAISIAASSNQFAAGTISYNSGSVDPGSFGKVWVWASDPQFAGGAVPYSFSPSSSGPQGQTASEGNVLFGSITTVNGTGKTGGGFTGGTGGSAGGRGFIL